MSGTVALTGATGFIGRHLATHLARNGWRVRLLARRPPLHPQFADVQFEVVPGALDDPAALARLAHGADCIVHAAGAIKARSRADFFAINADGTARLAEAAARSPSAPRVVLVSSLAARAPQLSAYAASKRAGEQALAAAADDLSWIILRPSAVYGPWDRETFAIFRTISRGVAPMLGDPAARLSMVHVDDVVAAVAAALPRDGGSGIFEVDDGCDGGYSWAEIVAAAAEAVGVKPRAVRVPPLLLQGVGWVNEGLGGAFGRAPMLTSGKVREILHPDWTCGPDRYSRLGGWTPKIGLAEGFETTVAWYRRHAWL